MFEADIPMLPGIDLLDPCGIYADNVDNDIVIKKLRFHMRLVRKFCHMYLEWPIAVSFFNKRELKKLYRHFKHPSVEKIMNLLMLSKVPRNVDLVLTRGDMFHEYRETDKKYMGPYLVERVYGTQVFLIVKDHEVQHNIDQVILASDCENVVNGDYSMDKLLTSTSKCRSARDKQ